jgi:hypothetical protein
VSDKENAYLTADFEHITKPCLVGLASPYKFSEAISLEIDTEAQLRIFFFYTVDTISGMLLELFA